MLKQNTPRSRLKLLACLIACPTVYAGSMGASDVAYPKGLAFMAGAGETGFNNSGNYRSEAGSATNIGSTRGYQYGFMGNFAAGYNRPLNALVYLGSELGVNIFGNRKSTSESASQNGAIVHDVGFTPGAPPISTVILSNNLSTKTTVSTNVIVPYLDLKTGLFIYDKTLLLARLGVNYNQITVNTISNYHSTGLVIESGVPGETVTSSVGLNSTAKKQVAGLRTGLGLEYLLSENISISTHYVYAFYNSFNTSSINPNSDVACDVFEGCSVNADGNYLASGRSKVGAQQVLLELIYHLS